MTTFAAEDVLNGRYRLTLPLECSPPPKVAFPRGVSLRNTDVALPSVPLAIHLSARRAAPQCNEETVDEAEGSGCSEDEESDLAITVSRASVSVSRGAQPVPLSSFPATSTLKVPNVRGEANCPMPSEIPK